MGAIIFSAFMGWLRHALARLRSDLVAANAPLPGAALGDAADASAGMPLRDAEGGPAGSAGGRRGPRLTRWQAALACGALRRSHAALRAVDALVYAALATISFLNMLIAMTFNPGLLAAVVAGEVAGVLTLEPVGGLVRGEALSAAEAAGRGCH